MLIVNAVAMLSQKVGDYIYRVEQPSIAMAKTEDTTVITVKTISPWFKELCLAADILILHLLSEHELLPIIEERKRKGRPTVYELSDNILSLHAGIGIRKWFSDPINLSLAFQYMRMADAVQVTGQGLAEQFAFIKQRIVVFENQITTLGQMKYREGSRILIGWAGSSGHRSDIEEIISVISDVIKDFSNVDFAIMGDRIIYKQLSGLLPVNRIFYSSPGTLEDYLSFLQKLDIGLAPLQDNPYNHCRSDVKFIEYASRGVVPVLRFLTPYRSSAEHGKTAFLYNTPHELWEILTKLAKDKELREKIKSQAYNYVNKYRMEDLHAGRRLDLYSSLIKSYPDVSTINKEIPLNNCSKNSEYYEVEACEADSLLIEGIQLASSGNDKEAEEKFLRSASAFPGYSLPWFWLGYCAYLKGDTKADKWFDEAINRDPRYLRAHWLKANSLKAQDPSLAFSEMGDLLNLYPNYAPAAFFMGEILESHKVYDESLHWYDEALRVNPFISPAALGLGRIFEIKNRMKEAEIAYRKAADMAPSWVEAQYAMARWAFARSDMEKAMDYCRRVLEIDLNHNGAQTLSKKILAEGLSAS